VVLHLPSLHLHSPSSCLRRMSDELDVALTVSGLPDPGRVGGVPTGGMRVTRVVEGTKQGGYANETARERR
jgi:hypothetical protein